jgi:hypothetical protein
MKRLGFLRFLVHFLVMANRVFFPQIALDTWVIDGKVELAADELRLPQEERRYHVEESVRVVAELTSGVCPRGLIGKVKSRKAMLELGAELMDQSMILGDNAYEVVPGWTGTPIGSWGEHITGQLAKLPEPEVGSRPVNDEDLLARFLLRSGG